MPSPACNWNVPKACVEVPGTVMNPAGPMPPEATTDTLVEAATLTLTAVWPTTFTVTDITGPSR
jgi:hypothetical protein